MQIYHKQFYKMARINRLRIYFIPFGEVNRKISISQPDKIARKRNRCHFEYNNITQ